MQPNGQRGLYLLTLLTFILVLIMVISSAISYFGISKLGGSRSASSDISFFDTQNAMVTGTITEAKDNIITIQNKKGDKKEFKASKIIMIMGGKQNSNNSAGSSDLKSIEKGKEYMVTLIAANGELEVSSVSPTSTAEQAVLPITNNTGSSSAVPNPAATAPKVTAPPAPNASAAKAQ